MAHTQKELVQQLPLPQATIKITDEGQRTDAGKKDKGIIMFEKMKNTDFSIWKVILLAVLCGVATAVILLIPALKDTSFHNIGVCFEFWFVPAVWIGISCKSAREAALKVFVFFLISQPLVYLIQVPFSSLGWGIFQYYRYWLIWTVLTIPGGAIVWLGKKNGWIGTVVALLAAAFLLCLEFCIHFRQLISSGFQHQLLACVFILLEVAAIILIYCKTAKQRLLAVLCSIVLAVAPFILNSTMESEMRLVDGNTYSVVFASDGISAELDGNTLCVRAETEGEYEIILETQEGERVTYTVIFNPDGVVEWRE